MKVGASRIDITPELKGPLPLLGWGDANHVARSVCQPIHSRAVAFEDAEGNRLVFVCVEICFVSESLRLGVMSRLRQIMGDGHFEEHEVVITATHTHNAPGGYCHSILYNIPSRGYSPVIYDAYVTGVTDSIMNAWGSRRASTLRAGSVDIPLHEPVAFNRSVEAYNQNADVEPVPKSATHRAVSRTMDGIAAFDDRGELIAYVNWFAVHCTSVHRDFFAIHSDHKGLAACDLEREHSNSNAVVIFAQGAAGDVTPNFKKFWFKREMRGKFRDDLKSAAFNAEIQARHARLLLSKASSLEDPRVGSVMAYHDCTRIPIPPEWVGGRVGVSTGPAALGCSFMAGTAEGTGAPRIWVWLAAWILRAVYALKGRRLMRSVHGNKVICVELSDAKVFGDSRPQDLPIPSWLDPIMGVIRFWSKIRVFRGEPMSPTRMPVQLFRIGEWGFAAVPGEFTTQSGLRLRNLLRPILSEIGIQKVVVSGYANSYAGYVTTEEEYQLQRYEGACTHFGRYTLLGYLALFRQLSERWIRRPLSGPEIRRCDPPRMKSPTELRKLQISP